jgi:exodeoxyribonuclease X
MIIHVLDTETTGPDPEKDRVVELAAVEVAQVLVPGTDEPCWSIGAPVVSFVNPRIPIPPEASGVHHIVDADVAGAPDLGEAIDRVLGPMWRDRVDIIAAHNARFDRDMLPPLKEKRWLDTYRCSLHVWPDAPDFKNGTLFYYTGGVRMIELIAHRSLFDATLTAHILVKLLAERTVDELLVLSHKAVVLKKVGFGKHFGSLWVDVPDGYIKWALRVDDLDPDVKFTVKKEAQRRGL